MAIELISKIKPKNNGNFKLVDAQDVEYNGKGLDEAIASGEFKGDKGDRGDIGPMGPTGPTGSKGDNGNDGFSPTVSVVEELDGVTVTVQNKDGAQTAKVKNGKDYEHSEEFTTLAEQVRADKESVEQSKTSVEQTVAQAEGKIDTAGTIAIQGVQNEGTTQTEKVTVEGTKQITEIQSKGEEILHSFPQDFPTQMATKLDKQQGVENVGKTVVVGEDGNLVVGEVQSGDDLAIVATASGEAIVVGDSTGRKIKGFRMTGKTEQVQTSGKNLFDFSKLETGRINYITGALEEHNHIRRLADYIDITDITSFSVYLPGYNKANGAVYVVIYYYDKDKKYLSYRACGNKQEKYENIAPVENAVYIKVTLEQNTIDNPQNIFKVQLEKGTTATPYEPYTGGKPSPSPEYPQEIKNSGKWNDEKQKYEVDVKITGKNLFDKGSAKKGYEFSSVTSDMESPKEGWFVSDFILVIKGKVYISGKSTGSGCKLYNKDKVFVENIQAPSGALTIKDGISYFRLNGEIKDLDNVQVEYGSVATSYEPYKKTQTLTLTSDRPITKWDKLVEQDGQIGWLYNSKIDNLDGQSHRIQIANKQGNVQHFAVLFDDVPNGNGNSYVYVNKYRAVNVSYSKAEYGICCNWNSGVKYFSAPNESITTVDAFKAWLSKNPLTITYQTASVKFVPLPQEEQNAIRAMTTYYPSTIVTNDQGCTMELDYVADTKNFILGQIGNLQKSLVNTQVQLL